MSVVNLDGTPKQIANGISSYVSNVCGDVGYEVAENPWDDDQKAEVRRLKNLGVTDIGGRIADDRFNDAGFLEDMIGDQLYGVKDPAVWDAVEAVHGHTAWKVAVNKLRREMIG